MSELSSIADKIGGAQKNPLANPASRLTSGQRQLRINTPDFALNIATRSIDFYDEAVSSISVPKSDHVALPDFSSGAMENWGLITYRESCLRTRIDPRIIQALHCTVIAHEAQPSGSADFGYHAVVERLVAQQKASPIWWNMWQLTLQPELAYGKRFYEWSNGRAQENSWTAFRWLQPTSIADEISTLFDPAIVYARADGCCYGPENLLAAFRAGLKSYFEKIKAYKNTVRKWFMAEIGISKRSANRHLMTAVSGTTAFPVVSDKQSRCGDFKSERLICLTPTIGALWYVSCLTGSSAW